MEYFVSAAFGLEGVTKSECEALGYAAKAELGGVRLTADAQAAPRLNINLRTADRVLIIVSEGRAETFDELFELTKQAPWGDYLPSDARFPVAAHCARSRLMSESDCQKIVKKAVAEKLKQKYALSWFAETGAEYPITLSLHGDSARISLDTSGAALNRRGYRTWNGEAPLRETLAAAIVLLSPWGRYADRPLCDPCCGTGTLLIEGAMLSAKVAPGLNRAFAGEKWPLLPGFAQEKEEARAKIDLTRLPPILGNDIDEKALELARRHIAQANLSGKIELKRGDLRELEWNENNIQFLCNPPYGVRMGERENCRALYAAIRALVSRHQGSNLSLITADPAFERCYGRRADKKRRLYNGRIECELVTYREG